MVIHKTSKSIFYKGKSSTFRAKNPSKPNFDHIIRNGLFFTHCITPSDQTGTSLASIFTGKYPVSSGVTQYSFNFDFTTFFDELEKLGYNLYSCVTDLLMLKKITKNFKHNLEYIYGGTNSYPYLEFLYFCI